MNFSMQQLSNAAVEHAITYAPTELDALGQVITRLAGDTVVIGDAEALVIAMARSGIVEPANALGAFASSLPRPQATHAPCSFDPFGDSAERGYLQNHFQADDKESIKLLEHLAFMMGLESTFAYLASRRTLGYSELLAVHRMVFQSLYPWAGTDRNETAPALAISKGIPDSAERVVFASPADISRTVAYALRGVENKREVRKQAGTILGNLAFAHPFLDGNGRALLTFHIEICHRAGFAIEWIAIKAGEYLAALSNEINNPDAGHMNEFLEPYIYTSGSRNESIRISALGR